jgi:HEAT repeat protein
LRQAVALLAAAVDEVVAGLRTNQFAAEFHLETPSPLGPIILGGAGRNIYTNEAFLIVDTGGDDRYENSAGGANGLAGRPVAIVIDLAGNDEYVARHSVAQGAGVFGVGLLVDGGGDDVFAAKHLAQGAGLFGAGILAAGPGRQTFAADSVAQGAASFGLGILWQRGGNSTYRANQMAQGFGSVAGRGLLLDAAGNDLYYAGGRESCPWLPGQYFSLAQGFGYGLRPFAGGGTGILGDLTGDDRYVADVYGQGASYWYAAGMLLDGAGHDAYQLYQYGQGAGIHLSSGVLLDAAGDDHYSAQAIAQGGAHDYSVGVLWDRAGDDRYSAASTAQGAALNNSFALLRDDAGADFYAGRDPRQTQAAGHDGGKREYGAVALLLDLGGVDVYSPSQTNNTLWLKPWHGAGLDTEWKQGGMEEWRVGGLEDWQRGEAARRTYRPVDAQHPVERLLRRATSDKPDAGQAWAELKQSGPSTLPYLLSRLDSPNVLVQAKTEELIDHLGTNAVPFLIAGLEAAPNDEVARLCCYFLARFEAATNAIPRVLPLLARDKTRPVALYTLGHLRARAAVAPAVAALREERELARLRAAQALGRIGDRQAVPALLAALDDELWTVRYAAQDALVALGRSSLGPLRAAWAKAPPRARPHLLDALAKLGDRRAVAWAEQFYAQDDPLVRTARRNQLRALLATARR